MFKVNNQFNLRFAWKYAQIFVHGLNLLREANSFPRVCSSRKTVSFEEEVMSNINYPRAFLLQLEANVFIILQLLQHMQFWKLVNISWIFPGLGWRENIWWIMRFSLKLDLICLFITAVKIKCWSTTRNLLGRQEVNLLSGNLPIVWSNNHGNFNWLWKIIN